MGNGRKLYLATYDDGHDFGSFNYWSSHRNKSKANLQDAENAYHKKHGWKRYVTIISTELYPYL